MVFSSSKIYSGYPWYSNVGPSCITLDFHDSVQNRNFEESYAWHYGQDAYISQFSQGDFRWFSYDNFSGHYNSWIRVILSEGEVVNLALFNGTQYGDEPFNNKDMGVYSMYCIDDNTMYPFDAVSSCGFNLTRGGGQEIFKLEILLYYN